MQLGYQKAAGDEGQQTLRCSSLATPKSIFYLTVSFRRRDRLRLEAVIPLEPVAGRLGPEMDIQWLILNGRAEEFNFVRS